MAKSLAAGGQAEWFEQLWLHGLHVKISFLMINKNNGKACWMAYGVDRHLRKQGVKCSLSNLGDEHVGSPVRAFQPSSSSLTYHLVTEVPDQYEEIRESSHLLYLRPRPSPQMLPVPLEPPRAPLEFTFLTTGWLRLAFLRFQLYSNHISPCLSLYVWLLVRYCVCEIHLYFACNWQLFFWPDTRLS